MRVCSIDGCGKRQRARGWCNRHYSRWLVHGNPAAVLRKASPAGDPARFIALAAAHRGTECLLWPYARNSQGRGHLDVGSRKYELAHRLVCEAAHGPAPSRELIAAHSCGNGHLACVNPQHLRWATHAENAADMVKHGRSRRGMLSFTNKLSERNVLDISRRARLGENRLSLAREFKVHRVTIDSIARGSIWGWLTGGAK